jgi:hypothetical protein
MRKSKFNVDQTPKGKQKRTYNSIIFDSELERNYYIYLLGLMAEGKVVSIELQPKYILQNSYIRNDGKKIRAVKYIADFKVSYSDGSVLVVDTKGKADSTALLKKKLLEYRHPDIKLIWVCWSKCDNGWIEYDELQKARKQRKKTK